MDLIDKVQNTPFYSSIITGLLHSFFRYMNRARISRNYLIFIYIILTAWTKTCFSDETPFYFSLISENDIYAPKAQDRHYTNGLKLSYGTRDEDLSQKLKLFFDKSPLAKYRYQISVGQNLYTPENFISEEIQLNDRPFAGWLYGEYTATANYPDVEKALSLNIGLVGPAALGRQTQSFNHSIINDPEPRGWINQLSNEPSILIKYRWSKFTRIGIWKNFKFGLISRFGLSAGNVFTDTGAGLLLRIGNYLPNIEMPGRNDPGYSGNSTYVSVRNNRFDWQIFTEIQGRGVLQNIFLDGNTFSSSHSVAKKPFVWETSSGLLIASGYFKYPIYMAFSLTWRSREFDLQNKVSNFGSALVGIQY